MLLPTSSRLRQGPTHVTDTGRCPTPCPNPTEVAQLRQLSLCCSRSGVSPSSWACSVLIPALQLSRAAVCAATELSVHCSQDLSDLRMLSVLRPDRRGEPVVTTNHCLTLPFGCVDMLYPHFFFGCAKPVLCLCSPVSWLCLPVFGCACGSL